MGEKPKCMRRTERKITGKGWHWPKKWGVSWDTACPPPTPRRDSLGPWDPRVLSPQPPTPQLMGLKGKGCRAGLSGNDRKKQGEEVRGRTVRGGGWALKTLSATPPAASRRWAPLTFLQDVLCSILPLVLILVLIVHI